MTLGSFADSPARADAVDDTHTRPSMAMEIFADGELEEAVRPLCCRCEDGYTSQVAYSSYCVGVCVDQMRKNDKLEANSLASWWRLFCASYEELIQSITKPVRATYTLADLGAREFTVTPRNAAIAPFTVVREDLELVNARHETLVCSFWHRKDQDAAVDTPQYRESVGSTNSSSSRATALTLGVDPCVLYLHEMSSSRKECVYLRDAVLAAGFSLFAFDFSGSGQSEGDRVSFGHFEQHDVHAALDYLYATGRVSSVSVWGRGIGGAAAALHLETRRHVRYTSLVLTQAQAWELQVVEDRASGRLFCVRPSMLRLPFRFTRADVSNGDVELLAIGHESVRGWSAAACMDRLRATSDARVRVAGVVKAEPGVSDDAFVTALTLDCAFGDLEQVIADAMGMVSASAQRRQLAFPAAMVSAAAMVIGRSVRKSGGFALRDVRPVDAVAHSQPRPCLFLCASKKDFFTPAHTRALHTAYNGPKALLQFDGAPEQNRSNAVLDAVVHHFQTALACGTAKASP